LRGNHHSTTPWSFTLFSNEHCYSFS